MTRTVSKSVSTTYQLYFGRVIDLPQLGHEYQIKISDRDFQGFIKDHVVPNFKNFSITNGVGYWKGTKEDINIVTIISDDFDDAGLVYDIAETYKRNFSQDAVLVNTFSCFPNLV